MQLFASTESVMQLCYLDIPNKVTTSASKLCT